MGSAFIRDLRSNGIMSIQAQIRVIDITYYELAIVYQL